MVASALVLDRVAVRDVRNLERVDLELGPGITIVHGDNGQGKTSLLEAMYFAATSRSFRTRKLGEVVRHGVRVASVHASFSEHGGIPLKREQTAAIEGASARVRVDGDKPESLAAYATLSPVVAFHAGDLELSSGPMAGRRRLLDRLSLFRDPTSADHRARYDRAIKARQEILRRGQGAPSAELDAFERLAGVHGAALTRARREATEALRPALLEALADLAAPGLAFGARYVPGGSEDEREAVEALQARRARDVGRPSAGVGPHRDDLLVELGGHAARTEASQGQHRAITLALKVAEARTVAEARGVWPVLLLDDVSSELDPDRTSALLRLLSEARGQTLVTTTRPDLIAEALGALGEPRRVRLAGGRVEDA